MWRELKEPSEGTTDKKPRYKIEGEDRTGGHIKWDILRLTKLHADMDKKHKKS
jgi:hypothetical protein